MFVKSFQAFVWRREDNYVKKGKCSKVERFAFYRFYFWALKVLRKGRLVKKLLKCEF